MMVNKAWFLRIQRRGKELKVPYYASAAAARDGNLPYCNDNLLYYKGNLAYIIATCLYSQQFINLNYIIVGLNNPFLI